MDNTIFYPQHLIFELADIDSATSEATGYDAFRLLDSSLMTYWKPTSTAEQVIIIDTNKTDHDTSIYGGGFFCHNYATDHSAGDFVVYHSDDGATWGTAIISQDISDTAYPVQIFQTASIALKRYLKFVFTSMSTTIEISRLFFGKKIEIGIGPQYPEDKATKYHNLGQSKGGSDAEDRVLAIHRDGFLNEVLTYAAVNSTVYGYFEDLYDHCRGTRGIFVIKHYVGGSWESPEVVRLMTDTFTASAIAYQIYNIAIELKRIPYLTDGYDY